MGLQDPEFIRRGLYPARPATGPDVIGFYSNRLFLRVSSGYRERLVSVTQRQLHGG